MKKIATAVMIWMALVCILPAQQWKWLDKDAVVIDGYLSPYNYKIAVSKNQVYVVWQDNRFGRSDIFFKSSTDGGATWQSPDIRLDTGDLPGNSTSFLPQICCSGNQVFVVWQDDRNSNSSDIYFNSSEDGGTTWQNSDIRLDTANPPGSTGSVNPDIKCSGDNVYTVWSEGNGYDPIEIYFNYSADKGKTWKNPPIRINLGNHSPEFDSYTPLIAVSENHIYVVWESDDGGVFYNHSSDGGATWLTEAVRISDGNSWTRQSQISCSGNNLYVAWLDSRNGHRDIYFNHSPIGVNAWQASDIRLDTADPPGQSDSVDLRLCSSGMHAYAAWQDYRNVDLNNFFNASQDGGMSWLPEDQRIGKNDQSDVHLDGDLQLCSMGEHVFVVWVDERSGSSDLYFNTSSNNGESWLTADIRLNEDKDNPEPVNRRASYPLIACSGNRVYAVWTGQRDGAYGIYFNTTNTGPRADAGQSQKAFKGESVLLDGSKSSDFEDDELTFSWRILSAPAGSKAKLLNAHSAATSFIPDKTGEYEIRLVATDPFGAEGYEIIRVTATPPAYNLTLKAGEGGSIQPPPGLHSFEAGEQVEIAAVPGDGYRFSHWSGDIPSGSENQNPLILTMASNLMIEAHFQAQRTLTIIAREGGTTDPAPGRYFHDIGAEVTLTAIPYAYYQFAGWAWESNNSVSDKITIILDRDTTAEAVFLRNIYSPVNFSGRKVLNRSLSQSEYFHILEWRPHPDNAGISKYRIYSLNGATRTLIIEVDVGINQYSRRGVQGNQTVTYLITAVDQSNREGDAATVVIQ